MTEVFDIPSDEDQVLGNLRKIFWRVWKRDLKGAMDLWTWREWLLLLLQLPTPIIWGLLSKICTEDCWPADWMNHTSKLKPGTENMVAHYTACERVYPDAFVKAPWNSWSNIAYIEVGIVILYQWLCDRGKPVSENFWCFPFSLSLASIYMGVVSFNWHASISDKAVGYDLAGIFPLILWAIFACLYFILLFLLPQSFLKTSYWLRDLEFTLLKSLSLFAILIGLAWRLARATEIIDKSCLDALGLSFITSSGSFQLVFIIVILNTGFVMILVLVVWAKNRLIWKSPFIAGVLQDVALWIAVMDYGGNCFSGETAYYSTSIFQGVGLMHAMTGIAVLIAYYYFRYLSYMIAIRDKDSATVEINLISIIGDTSTSETYIPIQ